METKENIIRNSEEIQNNEAIEDIEQIQNNEEIESDSNEKNIEIIKIDDNKKKYICVKCKKEYDEPQKFCGKCGKKVIEIKTKELQYICSKCGAQNKEEDIYCCNCGKRLKGIKVFSKLKFSKLKTLIMNNKKKSIIVLTLILLLIAIPIIIFNVAKNDNNDNNDDNYITADDFIDNYDDDEDVDEDEDEDADKYTDEEKSLYDDVLIAHNKIRDNLKNPESMNIYGVRLYKVDDNDSEYIVFRITATNSFGGTVTDYYSYDTKYGSILNDCKVFYENGEYIDWDDVVEYSEYEYGN